MIRLTIPGEAVPQLRPRFARHGNFVQTYDPAKCRDYKTYIRLLAGKTYKGPPLEGAIFLRVMVYRHPPASWGKVRIAAALAGQIRPTTKPDLTNLVKGIEDALNGLVWTDDARIVEQHTGKWYADRPRVEIEIKELAP